MKFLLLIILLSIPLYGLQAQDGPISKEEINARKVLVMDFFHQNISVDPKTERSVSFMVDIFIQSLIKVGQNTPNKKQLEEVYAEVVKNHILLLGNYLEETEMEQYLNATRPINDGIDSCTICDSALKEDRNFCVFCGQSVE